MTDKEFEDLFIRCLVALCVILALLPLVCIMLRIGWGFLTGGAE